MPTETPPPAVNGAALSPLDVLTLAQAAAYLQLPEDAVRAEAEAGRLPGRSVAGEWRFLRDAIVGWLSGCDRPPASERKLVGNVPSRPSARDRQLAVAGCLADDDSLGPMVEEIYRERKRNPVGGGS
jgi:hypothetical protein